MNFRIVFLSLFLFTVVISCKKKPVIPPMDNNAMKNGILVLNEGLFQLNNSNMSWIDLSNGMVNNQIFEEKTGRQLGDTGNDMLVYGSKLYIVTSVSSTMEILDAKTLQPLKQLSIVENGASQQPRSLTKINGEVYLSTFGGKVWCIDTATLEVKAKIQVGLNPDQITNDGQFIYVSNSGGLNNPVYDSTVSVINPISKIEVKKITVGKNPGPIIVGPDNNIYVITRGNYTSISARLHRINTSLFVNDITYGFDVQYITNLSNSHFIVGYLGTGGKTELAKFNIQTQELESKKFIDISNYKTFYHLSYQSKTNQFYAFDAMSYSESGKLNIYNFSGALVQTYSVGLNPCKVILY